MSTSFTLPELKLPNIRKAFIPDPGYVICDCDLSGADAQVVAWEANDADLKRAFREGLNVHNHNGEAVWGNAYDPQARPRKFTMRDELKRAVHGTNYGATPRTLAITLGWTIAFATQFQRRWLEELHPNIRDWHHRTQHDLATTRRTSNAFGYRIIWLDRPENCFTNALAWTPQSTVGIVTSRGAANLRRNLPWVKILLQVHDSVVFQIPFHRYTPSGLKTIREHLEVTVPYPDPLIIPWGLATSEKSWGDVEKVNWPE